MVEVTDCSQKLCSNVSDERAKTSENVSNFGPLTASMNTNNTKHLNITNYFDVLKDPNKHLNILIYRGPLTELREAYIT